MNKNFEWWDNTLSYSYPSKNSTGVKVSYPLKAHVSVFISIPICTKITKKKKSFTTNIFSAKPNLKREYLQNFTSLKKLFPYILAALLISWYRFLVKIIIRKRLWFTRASLTCRVESLLKAKRKLKLSQFIYIV